jgi:hypothetical protein
MTVLQVHSLPVLANQHRHTCFWGFFYLLDYIFWAELLSCWIEVVRRGGVAPFPFEHEDDVQNGLEQMTDPQLPNYLRTYPKGTHSNLIRSFQPRLIAQTKSSILSPSPRARGRTR